MTFRALSKGQIIEKLDYAQQMANRFNAEMRLGMRPYEEAMGIVIINIGNQFIPKVKDGEVEFIENRKLVVPEPAADGSVFTPSYCLTHQYDPLCMVEYAARLAQEDCTSVVCIDDYNKEALPISHCNFKDIVLETRPGAKRLTYVC